VPRVHLWLHYAPQAEAAAILQGMRAAGGGLPAAAAAAGVDSDLRAAIYQTAARSSDEPRTAFDQLKALYLAAADADEKDRTLRALAHSPLAAPAALDLGLTPAVRAQDVRTLVGTAAAAGDAAAAAATWAWLKANWGALHAKLGGGCIARAQRSRPGDVDGASCCFVHVMPALGTLRCATRRLAPTACLSLVFFFSFLQATPRLRGAWGSCWRRWPPPRQTPPWSPTWTPCLRRTGTPWGGRSRTPTVPRRASRPTRPGWRGTARTCAGGWRRRRRRRRAARDALP
jgi:hypothetical protein